MRKFHANANILLRKFGNCSPNVKSYLFKTYCSNIYMFYLISYTKGMQLQFIVSRTLLISSATVIDRAGEAIWLNYFATVLFNLCSTVTVECCILYPCCVGVFGMFTVM